MDLAAEKVVVEDLAAAEVVEAKARAEAEKKVPAEVAADMDRHIHIPCRFPNNLKTDQRC